MTTIYKCLRCQAHHHLNCPVCGCVEHSAVTNLDLAAVGVLGHIHVRVGPEHHTLVISLISGTKKLILGKEDTIPTSP